MARGVAGGFTALAKKLGVRHCWLGRIKKFREGWDGRMRAQKSLGLGDFARSRYYIFGLEKYRGGVFLICDRAAPEQQRQKKNGMYIYTQEPHRLIRCAAAKNSHRTLLLL